MSKVDFGLIGTGSAAHLHINALKPLRDSKVSVLGVAACDEKKLNNFSKKNEIPHYYTNWKNMINELSLDVIDICSPTDLHSEMIKFIARKNIDIICEKPLSGFFGKDLGIKHVGHEVSRQQMYEEVLHEIEDIETILRKHDVKFLYAENWIYSPPYKKIIDLLNAGESTILEIRAEECHSGSPASYSRRWKESGGGALLRLGAHPVGGVLQLKFLEGIRKQNEPIKPISVRGEVSYNTQINSVQQEENSYIVKEWKDVEDWGVLIIDFSDGTKAIIIASDCVLGGIRNKMEVYTTNSALNFDLTQNNSVKAYAPNEIIFADEFITTMLETKSGWTYPSPDESWMRGYYNEMQNFIDCIIYDINPDSGFYLAKETLKIIYAGYLSAEMEKKVYL